MFEKKFLEIFVVILYWLRFTPYIYKKFTEKKWLDLDFGALRDTIWAVLIFILIDIMLFVTFYRIVIYAYKKLKKFDKKTVREVQMKFKDDKTRKDIEAQSISMQHLDIPDGSRKRTMISKLRSRF